jgi:hypothetical protein
MANTMNTKKIDIKLSELLNDLQNGHTWLQHEDVGYGSIQEKYAANELQIKMIQKHPKLSDVKPNITIFNIIDDLENEICDLLENELKKNIKNKQLISYNKIRKPVDIFIEHVVAMEMSFSPVRQSLTKHLFLPLDSQMFQSDFVFSDKERLELKIKKGFTFKDIEVKSHYNEIQEFLKQKTSIIGLENKIYFDLEWNDRWKSNGNNLFETNPKPKK